MSNSVLSVRSAKARDLAYRIAERENRAVAEVVERALEYYEARETDREPAAAFYARLSRDYGTDVDLEAVIHAARTSISEPEHLVSLKSMSLD